MKHTIVLLVMVLGMSTAIFGYNNNNASEKNLSTILKLLPDRLTPANVKHILGDAEQIKIDNTRNDEQWEYHNVDANIILRWQNGELKTLHYSGLTTAKTNWSNQNLGGLEMGVSTIFDAVKVLGEPRDMFVNGNDELIRYAYKNNILELRFRNGMLSLSQVLYTGNYDKRR